MAPRNWSPAGSERIPFRLPSDDEQQGRSPKEIEGGNGLALRLCYRAGRSMRRRAIA
jgi:hypothetical protein